MIKGDLWLQAVVAGWIGWFGALLASARPYDIELIITFTAIGCLGALAGVGAVVRSEKDISWRSIVNAVLNSGLIAIAVGAATVWRLGEENVLLAIFLAIIAGLGGPAFVEYLVQMLSTRTKWLIDKFTGGDDK